MSARVSEQMVSMEERARRKELIMVNINLRFE